MTMSKEQARIILATYTMPMTSKQLAEFKAALKLLSSFTPGV